MAAEKLTKARLVQILVMMALLISAFTWRTITHVKEDVACFVPNPCNISVGGQKIAFNPDEIMPGNTSYQMVSKDGLNLQIESGEGVVKMTAERTIIHFTSQQVTLQLSLSSEKRYLTILHKN
ncbi:hypothetical protein [Vibrio sp. SCSIO 43137]|uniref:hypothetical protein n=1 Tax=Vibrio sp. SCSIO 43137 TaxID=3021011 RepID=UPI0023073E67|nr:hypothetical protein [Vibrio sp. SCSIO 43137]WCE31305.1 hypothetical protein PK654_07650 [Vibrio sp. SCSIO 43137]